MFLKIIKAFFITMSFCNACCDFCRNPEQRKQAGLQEFAEQLEPIVYKNAYNNVEYVYSQSMQYLDQQHTLVEFLNCLEPDRSAYLRAKDPNRFIKVTCSDQGVFEFDPADHTEDITGANIYLKSKDDPVFAELLQKYPEQDEIKARLYLSSGTLCDEEPLYVCATYNERRIVVGAYPDAYLIGVQDGKLKFVKQGDHNWEQSESVTMEEAKLSTKILTYEEKKQQEMAEKERKFRESLASIIEQVKSKNNGQEPDFIEVSARIDYRRPEVKRINLTQTQDELMQSCKTKKTYLVIGGYLVCFEEGKPSFIRRIDFQKTIDIDEANVRTVWLEDLNWSRPNSASLWVGTSMHAARMMEALQIFTGTFWPNYCTTEYNLPLLDDETKKYVNSMPDNACGFAVLSNGKLGIVIGAKDDTDQYLSRCLLYSTELSYKSCNKAKTKAKERIKDLLLVTSAVEFDELTPIKSDEGTDFYLFCNTKAASAWESGAYKFNADEILSGCDAILYEDPEDRQSKKIICRSKIEGIFSTNLIYEAAGIKQTKQVDIRIEIDDNGNEKVKIYEKLDT